MESPPETTKLSFDKEKKEARGYGIATAILAIITFSLSFTHIKILMIIGGFSLLGLVGTGWQFLFHGSTAISMALQGTSRLLFQIFISIATPILFSIYFLKDAQSINLEGLFWFTVNVWLLLPIGIIAYISWLVAKYLDRGHPFRGFLIASTIIFVICFCGQHGIRFGNDEDAYGYNDSDGIEVLNAESKENQVAVAKDNKSQGYKNYFFQSQAEYDRHIEEVEGGFYLFLYIRYVAVSYTAMFLGMCWKRRSIKAAYQ